MAAEKRALLPPIEITLYPRLGQKPFADFGIAPPEMGFGKSEPSDTRQRRIPVEPGDESIVSDARVNGFLGAAPKLVESRPAGVVRDEVVEGVERRNHIGFAQREPTNNLGGEGVVCGLCDAARLGEPLYLCGREGPSVNGAILRGQIVRRPGRPDRHNDCCG